MKILRKGYESKIEMKKTKDNIFTLICVIAIIVLLIVIIVQFCALNSYNKKKKDLEDKNKYVEDLIEEKNNPNLSYLYSLYFKEDL